MDPATMGIVMNALAPVAETKASSPVGARER